MYHAAKTYYKGNFTMRISIKKHNQAYLQSLAKEMQIEDLGEALNYILVNIRGLGWRYGDVPQPQPQQPIPQPIGYTFEKAAPIPEVDRNSIDPIIARMASLIEEF
jgi:hypothetical protein